MKSPVPSACASFRGCSIVYLLAEIASLFAFWAWLAIDPDAWRWFVVPEAPRSAFGVFAPSDLLVIGGLGVWSAWTLWRGSIVAVVACAAHAGAVTYATIVACAIFAAHPQLWAAPTMMLPIGVASVWVSVRAWRDREPLRGE